MKIRFFQKVIDKLRGKNHLSKYRKHNQLILPDSFDESKLHIGIEGENNIIKIGKGAKIRKNFAINGYIDNSVIEIGENFYCVNESFRVGQKHPNFGKIDNVKIKIGANTSWETGQLVTYNSNSYVDIGDDCMFAGDVMLFNTDAHPVFAKGTKDVINKVKGIKIGNHVWLGMKTTVLKNSEVPNNSIVGWGTVFSGTFGGGGETHEYCAFGGNPAKIIKRNVDWDKCGAKYGYIENRGIEKE